MNYEDKYKEALERAKTFQAKYGGDYAEYIFPELRESKDERIRTRFIEYFQGFLEGNEDCYKDGGYVRWEGLDVKSILAWLEKQKEQKPAEWSEEIIRKAVKEVGLTQHQIDWFKTNVFPPKVEWSEEDEDMLNSCISSIEEAKENRYAYKETDGDTSYDREVDWLESLRNRVGKESLQPHWKPAEELIARLEQWLKDKQFDGDSRSVYPIFESLYKLLKLL